MIDDQAGTDQLVVTATRCLVPGCQRQCVLGGRDGSARGLCGPCYQAAARGIRLKETSWRELEDLGLAQPSTRRRQAPKPTRFSIALQEARKHASEAKPANEDSATQPVAGPVSQQPLS